MSEARSSGPGSGVVINAAIIVIGLIGIVALLAAQLFGDDASPAEPLDLSIRLETVAAGFDAPVLLAGDGEGDRYVVEQDGHILRLSADGEVEPELFLDIRDRVLYQEERGLLGLAFHPGFGQNGRLFTTYSRRGDGATVISEFQVPDDDSALEATERAVLTIPQPFTTHKAGMLAFDHEGMLLAAIGDGGSANDPLGNGQDRASLLGKLLRLDVDHGWPYATPADNGFADDPAARAEIQAIGLRDPWRFSLDRETGHAYIGDAGQSQWEEIDVLAPGAREASFGWSVMEGEGCVAGHECVPGDHIAPAVAYAHEDGETGHCAVVGGYAYRGAAGSLPAGTYLYADHCSGTIWAVPAEQLQAGAATPAVVGRVPTELGQPRSFGVDDAGELYLVTTGGYVMGLGADGEAPAG